ncbi:uncharacterized protein TrAtP1_001195 [Trichoderma atroviride]|uniref:uncharacterized protein n=1 Tax=Hypocrea atroviridis TaxID=63577 RepID=UPI0033342FE0|nr:hypothetical protein TrAtP1_001195 [Trichoderma atroviride]
MTLAQRSRTPRGPFLPTGQDQGPQFETAFDVILHLVLPDPNLAPRNLVNGTCGTTEKNRILVVFWYLRFSWSR